MPIEFSCSECQSVLRTPDDTAGKAARCPNCGSLEEIPEIGVSEYPVASAVADQVAEPAAKPVPNPFGVRPDQPQAHSSYAAAQYPGGAGHFVSTRQSAKSKLMPPAITLLILHILGVIGLLLAMTGGLVSLAENGNNADDVETLIFCSVMLALQVLGIVGCISMLTMRRYVFGIMGIICSIVAGIPCCFIPTGIGVWALVVMLDPNVKRFFH